MEKIIPEKYNYLSEVFDFLPSHVLLDKGMTGCGGTTLELTCPRNSIVLVPTINLVENKVRNGILGITYKTDDKEIDEYLNSSIKYKKIIGTYDSLSRVINKNLEDYFLLIDEYHYLFTYYKFRQTAIRNLLEHYKDFKDWCFMTATPLSQDNILEELKDIETLSLKWEGKAKLEIQFTPTEFYNKVLQNRIYDCLHSDYNLHIFLNNFATIKKLVEAYLKLDYRVVCSPNQRDKSSLNFQHVNSQVRKINFYTATAFEGVDIFDEKGKTLVVSDSRHMSTMMDISIFITQIAGRIRDSQWINKIEYIFSASKHRYLNKNDIEWEYFVAENKKRGMAMISLYNKGTAYEKETNEETTNQDKQFSYYVNKNETGLFFDPNLVKCDYDNYRIFKNLSELYTQRPKEKARGIIINSKFKSEIEEIAYRFLIKGHEYTRQELEDLFFDKQLISKKSFQPSFISDNFDNFQSKRKTIRGKKYTVYTFY